MPFVQGLAWTLIVAGWRTVNQSSKFSGQTVGARVRRWWWGVNNWTLPDKSTLRDRKLAEDARTFFTDQGMAG